MNLNLLKFFREKRDVPKTVCPVPWVNLSVDVDGSTRPCCKFTHQSQSSKYELANLKENTLEEVWNANAMVSLREDFLAGIKPKECNACWNEEKAGVKSYRETFLDGRTNEEIDYYDTKPEAPITLDLKLSNVCNLKCRICGPVASSLWLKEELTQTYNDGHEFKKYIKDNRSYFLSDKITDKEENKTTLVKWLRGIKHIEITGGEPLLSPENKWLLDTLVEEGRTKEISLLYNTNATIFSSDVVEKWKKFKRVTICLSIDDIEKRFEYERSPAKWESVMQNINLYTEAAGTNIELTAFCSVSIFNVFFLPEYLNWFRRNHGEIQVYLNYVHYDRHFCVQIMPTSLKKVVEEKLTEEILRKPWAKEISNKVKDLINFMNEEAHDGPTEWKRFVRVTALRDKIRKESFKEVFPELYSHIDQLNLTEPVSMLESVVERIKGNEPESF